MTIEEAIKKAEGIAEEKFNNAVYIMDKMKSDIALENAEECKRCAEEHRQLAEWLKDYKRLLEQEPKIVPIAVIKLEYDEDKLKELVDKAVLTVSQSDVAEVLDKVRAEIKNDWQLKKSPCSPFSCGLRQAIEIIDKYREEVHHMVSEAGK